MRLRFLGTAAGGGLPQWNCGCPQCEDARRDPAVARTQDCMAVSGDGQSWYLLNASPDLHTQLARVPELAPLPGTRATPIRGVLLTSAELDHTLGLVGMRQATTLSVYATKPVQMAVTGVLECYTTVDWQPMPTRLDGGLTVTAFPVSSKRPRYAADLPDAPDWAIALRLDSAHGSVVYAPCLPDEDAVAAVADIGADVIILDGTFYDAAELATCPPGVAGHLPIRDSLPILRRRRGPRYLYTHLNNTNPAALAGTPAYRAVLDAGVEIAPENGFITLDPPPER